MGIDITGNWAEYWGTFNSSHISSFTTSLDQLAELKKKKSGWLKIAISGISLIVGLFAPGAIWLNLIYSIITSIIFSKLQDLFYITPNELNNLSLSIRSTYESVKNSLIIYFLEGSHDNQIKIVNSINKRVLKILTLRSNIIGDLITIAEKCGVRLRYREVALKYSY